MSLINFDSLTEIKEKKHLEREARQLVLDKAREKHEKGVKKEQEARERGETTWMLPSVEAKINPKQKEKKKKKKDKKEKTKKKKKKKKKSSSSASSTSGSENENEKNDTWVEKTPNDQPTKREEWMEISSLFKTQTREQMKIADRSSRALKKLEERKRKEDENKPGSHARELNPYYKDGGIGLPSKAVPSNTVKISSYDASWLRKALQRAKDQAAKEGKTLEEVAAERWGDLDTFYKLLNEAENEGNKSSTLTNKGERECKSTDRQEGHREDYFEEKKRRESKIKNRRSRSQSRERKKINRSRSRERRRSISRTRDRGKKKRSRSREKNKQVQKNNEDDNSRKKSRSRSRSRERNRYRNCSRSSSSDGSRSSSSSDSSSNRRRRRRSRNDSDSSIERKRSISRYHERTKEPKNKKSEKLQMLKPPESDDEMTYTTHRQFQKPDDTMDLSSGFQVQRSSFNKNKPATWRKKTSEVPEIISSSKTRSPKSKDGSSSSSASDSDGEEKLNESRTSQPEVKPAEVVPVLTDKEMNQLAAKLTKAELLGNTALVDKLKAKLDAARTVREKHCGEPSDFGPKQQEERDDSVVILTRTDKTGFIRPVEGSSSDNRGSKKKKMNMYDSDGKRTSYFADDFRSDLRDMFEKEKTTSAEDQIAFLENMPQYTREKLSDDFDVDDMFIAKVAPKESGEKERERDRKRAIWEHQKSQKVLDSCHFCIDNKLLKKHLIVALGKKCYVSLPYHQSLTEGHCMIVPLNHVPCGTQAEEDLWEEITSFRQALVRMFSSNDEDCIFFETATKLHQMPHMVLQCIPLPKETGDLAPIYFKKAILECDEEWVQNKKLIDLQGKTVRRAVPKGLPYFYVDFGMTPGFAHVIENELIFPNNFAQEIIGGMIDADYSLFRKPKAENFDLQRKKVLKFGKMFQPFDPTENN